MSFYDLLQAIRDLKLELFLTGLLLLALFLAGWQLRGWSLRRHLEAEDSAKYANRKAQTIRTAYSASFWQGISTELFGAVISTFAFGIVLLIFQQFQFIQNRKAELILQMGSPSNEFALEATRQLSVLGWLGNGTLEGAYLAGANLENAKLDFGYFQKAYLVSINLSESWLVAANLQEANLTFGILEGIHATSIDLRHAKLIRANLKDAILHSARLQGADLTGANLEGSLLFSTEFDDETILPDKTNWSSETDLSQFTDSQHTAYWRGYQLEQSIGMNVNFSGANLRGVSLFRVDLQGINLNDANLQNAILKGVNLQNAILTDANLQGVDLSLSDLRGADLTGAIFDKRTLLPDARGDIPDTQMGASDNPGLIIIYTPESYWSPSTDMSRFTDPQHPDFWSPN